MEMIYCPEPLDADEIELPAALAELSEAIARNVHETWAAARMREGWSAGEPDPVRKTHPGLVPYDRLPESEKDYDRRSTEAVLKFVIASGFEIKKTSL